MKHYQDDDLILYYYGEGRYAPTPGERGPRNQVATHLDTCADCAATYHEITDTLAMVT